MDRSRLEAAIDSHIDEMHTVLWGKAYDVVASTGRRQAIEDTADLIEAVMRRYKKKPKP